MNRLTSLTFWADPTFRSPSENMALDEALFDEAVSSRRAVLRCYHWDRFAMTIGYFSHWDSGDRPGQSVRRWTGGGRVEHGEDLTFALAIPASENLARQQSSVRYSQIHTCLMDALSTIAVPLLLKADGTPEKPDPAGPAACFHSPVASDLMNADGEKIAGGAQRRVGGAILHQGSIRLPLPYRKPDADWILRFREELARENERINDETKAGILSKIREKLASRYDLSEWNRQRE